MTPTVAALVIGGGPAGLAAAEILSERGHEVLVADAKPSLARKFLMAGKTGLNLTKREDFDAFCAAYSEGGAALRPMLRAFGSAEAEAWAEALGQEMFAGSTGRVFPRTWKASPMLRAWLGRLSERGVRVRTNWGWQGWDDGAMLFDTPEGEQRLKAHVTVLALGGASWARLGSDGLWATTPQLAQHCAPFQPSNVGLRVQWTAHMQPHFGKPIKAVEWHVHAGGEVIARSRGEAILSERGLEGGGIYPLIPALRRSRQLTVDLTPDVSTERLVARLPKHPKGETKMLRNVLRWPAEKIALFQELKPRSHLVAAGTYGSMIKSLSVQHQGPRPLDEAISTAGGLRFEALTDGLELRDRPGVFACGEMLDWDAPTGGYLLTACLATGRWAGAHAATRLEG